MLVGVSGRGSVRHGCTNQLKDQYISLIMLRTPNIHQTDADSISVKPLFT